MITFHKPKESFNVERMICEIIIDPVGLETFVGRKSCPIYSFKIMNLFPYIQLYSTPNCVQVI